MDFPASFATDGNTDGAVPNNSVTVTAGSEANPWWQVDLGSTFALSSIAIWNRTDCCGARLSDYWVFVSNSPFTDTDSFTSLQHKSGVWSSHQTTAPNPFTLISAAGVQGRYLRVQLSTSDYLSLAEVQVFGADDAPVPTLTAASSHTGHILQTGVYSVAVTNRGAAPTYGTLTVSDDSGGLIMGTVSGAGWTCTPAASSAMCTTNTALSGGLSSAPVSLNVSVPSGLLANTPEVTVTNTVTAGGGGAAGIATFSDPTLVGDYSPNVQPMTTVVENGVTKYQFTYTDADGFADIDHMQLMFNSSRAANSCWLVIDTAGNLYLADNN